MMKPIPRRWGDSLRLIWFAAAAAAMGATVVPESRADDFGRAIDYVVEEKGAAQQQTALVQFGRVSVKQAGGDPNLDILFDADTLTLYLIDHQNRSYYKIDRNVINKAASMLESLSEIAETQQGVLADLLNTLGLSKEEEAIEIVIRKTDRTLTAANIECRLYQQFRNEQLETEMCIASESNLGLLGSHYQTLNAFYAFGDLLMSRAGNILSNMGMVVPDFRKLGDEGLPILAYVSREKLKVSLLKIRQQVLASGQFQLPNGYVQTPIPFIG